MCVAYVEVWETPIRRCFSSAFICSAAMTSVGRTVTSAWFGSSVPWAIKSLQLPPSYPRTDALERITKCTEEPINVVVLSQ
jgi:hypothetical protein